MDAIFPAGGWKRRERDIKYAAAENPVVAR